MTGAPAVTVLLPTYNGRPFVGQAVDSILAQSFRDFELLIVDDASTDGTVEAVRRYDDGRIRLVTNDRNVGQTATLNRGIALSAGRYIARMDQDDVSLPARLAAQVQVLETRTDVAVVGTAGYAIDVCGRRIGASRLKLRDFGAFIGALSVAHCPLWHPSVMFRRDVVVGAGGYDAAYGPAEDYELWTRLARGRASAYVTPEPLLLYRVHDSQQSAQRAAAQRASIARAHQQLIGPLCPPGAADAVGALLRIDDALWTTLRPRHDLTRVLAATAAMFEALRVEWRLSASEWGSLRAMVARRLGHGLRMAGAIGGWPSALVYPVLFGLSPILIPGLRTTAAPIARWLRALPYRIAVRR